MGERVLDLSFVILADVRAVLRRRRRKQLHPRAYSDRREVLLVGRIPSLRLGTPIDALHSKPVIPALHRINTPGDRLLHRLTEDALPSLVVHGGASRKADLLHHARD